MAKKDTLNRRDFLKTMGYSGMAAATLPSLMTNCQASGERPNILFIFSDDHGYQAISAYGGRLAEHAPTPHIDRIAREGIRFDKCYVTNSICAPSRATILTGKHSHLNGITVNEVISDGVTVNEAEFDGSQTTFPKLLRESGYETAIIGKWHLYSEPTGFDYWEVLPGQGDYYNPDFKTRRGLKQETGYVTDIITDKALNWIQEGREGNKPFMMMLQHKAPHREWDPGPKHLDLFKDVEFPEPDNLFDDYENRGSAAKNQDMTIDKTMSLGSDLKVWGKGDEGWRSTLYARMNDQQQEAWDKAYNPVNKDFKKRKLKGKALVQWKYQRYLQDYLRCIRSVDENVGRVLEYLDDSGLAENTVVVYSSDQGFFLGEHGWFDKRFMYEESYRTPLVIRWPDKIQPGRVNSDLVSNLDFAQTFLDIAGVDQPSDMQGKGLVPILLGKTPGDWRKSLYYHYYEYPGYHSVRRHEGVSTARYKLLFFYDLDEWELYDFQTDPTEMTNQYDNPQYANIVIELKNELEKLRKEYKVPPLEPDPEKI